MWSPIQSKSILLKIVGTGIVAILCGLLILNVLIWTSDVSKLEQPAPQPTVIYDQNGNVASKISASNIEGVSVNQFRRWCSRTLSLQQKINAFISTVV